jgi:micrococcal nuclease
MPTLLSFLFILLLQPTTKEYYGKVIKITDGDTFELLLDDKTTVKVRLQGIDAPEKKQAAYHSSKSFLSSLIFGKRIKIIEKSRDKYRRSLAEIYIKNEWVNLTMITKGYAWHYKKYSINKQLANAELKARKKKIGLWHGRNPIAPWVFREIN